MTRAGLARTLPIVLLAALSLSISTASMAVAAGKVQLYVVRMVPDGQDAERFSRRSWGGGLNLVLPAPWVHNLFAGVAGLDIVNMHSETTEFRDVQTGLRVEQQTSQDYARFYLGGQIGPHGRGFFRPHVGTDLALVVYNTSTDVVVPDDANRENEIRQNLHRKSKSVAGWDVTLGADLNIKNTVAVEGGARFLKSFSVPVQLGAGSVRVEPSYFQLYLGVGISLDTFKKKPRKEEPPTEG